MRDVDLSIEEGSAFGIVGLSGSGKSTLLRCLCGLDPPSSGSVFIYEKEISSISGLALREVRYQMGMVFQSFQLLSSRSVYENVAYPLEISGKTNIRSRVEEVLGLVGIAHKKDAYTAELSGGEKQRVGIARALAGNPKVLFCDEATSALDPKTTREILALLKKLNKELKVTLVLITHEMDAVRAVCDKVAVLDGGRIVETGSLAEVFSHPKEAITRHFLKTTAHEIPPHFFQTPSPQRKLLRLCLEGAIASKPIISQMVKRFLVDANILLGWMDCLQETTVGNLVIELTGEEKQIAESLAYLDENCVRYEEL